MSAGMRDYERQPIAASPGWTDERVATLTKLWLAGLSAAQVAKQLGGATRNSVISKVHRLGLSNRERASAPPHSRYTSPAVRRGPTNPVGQPAHVVGRAKQGRAAPAASVQIKPVKRAHANCEPSSVPFIDKTVRPDERGAFSVMELRTGMCKWPIGSPRDETFGFCGKRVVVGPYCIDCIRDRKPYQTTTSAKELARSLRRFA
jgi:GcrA cell cycle regulator